MVEIFDCALPHGLTLNVRAAGPRGAPVLLFLHGFPEAAFVWDGLLQHFSQPAHGGWRCVAPNLRGFDRSDQPADPSAYRAKHLVQDIVALIGLECPAPQPRLGALIAHDWGGAVAWNLANQRPDLLERLVILNSPHPGTFVRELRHSPAQQAASAYMNFLVRPDAEQRLAENGFQRLFAFLEGGSNQPPAWLSPALRAQYRATWSHGLSGGCNYYRASPLRPATAEGPATLPELPPAMLGVAVPTQVLWGEGDHALLPGLLDGLEAHVPQLTVHRHPTASHWIVHEAPDWVRERIAAFLPPKR